MHNSQTLTIFTLAHFVRTVLMCALLFVAAACASSRSAQTSPGQSSAERSALRSQFEILVIGTVHAPWQFRSREFTPGHIRAALELAEPDVIGIESNPTWFAEGKFHEVTYEAQEIAVPFGKSRALPVYGIDYMEIDRWNRDLRSHRREQWDAIQSQLSKGVLPLARFGKLVATQLAKTQSFFESPEFDFHFVNQVYNDDYAQNWLGRDPDDPEFGGERNRQIVGNCLKVMERHHGKRLVVVIGAGHKAILDALFKHIEGVRVLKLGRDLPPPPQQLTGSAWATQDLIVALGHNLDGERSYFHPALVDLDRMTKLVNDLKPRPNQMDIARYFEGRIHFMRGDIQKALQELDALAEKQGVLYPFPMDHWRMRYNMSQAARLEKARILLAQGKREHAAKILNAVSSEVAIRIDATNLSAVPEQTQLLPLQDAGFEKGELSSIPLRGWCCDEVDVGRSRAYPDEDRRMEGARSLCVETVEQRDMGRPSLRRSIEIPEELRNVREYEFSINLSAEHIPYALLEAYVWDMEAKIMQSLSVRRVPLRSRGWSSSSLRFEVPKEHQQFHIFIYYPSHPGAKIWFDDAKLQAVSSSSIPSELIPLILAKEFPKTLLSQTDPSQPVDE